ncbi:hypothetical protein I6L25_09500 [Acinetobacter nosocomialis]|uniref:hypothetical protein n=1 Tax=Acinetobacter nosocomialis TaxID=106654 RepID=UPI0002D0F265|nr:hypothetical protein [Acinetobacter nosocomialis]ENU47275.1 hypothetical protein F984_01644 [Acinetobacter nosocomialis NIPH 2119]QXC10671.1 hypothetical protein I6L25_09500 [Acinetobacter nosocomialis]
MANKAIIDIAKILVANHYLINKEKLFDIEKILLPLMKGWLEFGDNGPVVTVVADYKGLTFKSETAARVVENSFSWQEVPTGTDLEAVLEFIEKILRDYFYIDENI